MANIPTVLNSWGQRLDNLSIFHENLRTFPMCLTCIIMVFLTFFNLSRILFLIYVNYFHYVTKCLNFFNQIKLFSWSIQFSSTVFLPIPSNFWLRNSLRDYVLTPKSFLVFQSLTRSHAQADIDECAQLGKSPFNSAL